MPRPPKWRCVAQVPQSRLFKPSGMPAAALEQVTLSLDGLEALRLLDLEGATQEEAAERMGVSRSTVSRLAADARRVVAETLVEGKALVIEGGPVAIERPPDSRTWGGRGRCWAAAERVGADKSEPSRGASMIIAVPYVDGQVNGHFGRTQTFLVAQAREGEVVGSAVYSVEGLQHNHGGLAGFLKSRGVDVVLAGGMGEPMQQALKAAGFELLCGVSGTATEAVEAYLRGELVPSEATCGHHHGEHHH
ncbi:MAG: DUF134 domain-containing protein [Thermoleophilia bacterium]|nr:DUF134 domain-containing protein [Thermoleophilia bacterium]